MLAVLVPTLAYVEDELGGRPARLVTCGFSPGEGIDIETDTGIPATPLASRWGTPRQTNAGLLGYLESIQ